MKDQADEEGNGLYCKEMQRGRGQRLGVSGIQYQQCVIIKVARFVDKVEKGLNEFRSHLNVNPGREIQKEDIQQVPRTSEDFQARALDLRVLRMWQLTRPVEENDHAQS